VGAGINQLYFYGHLQAFYGYLIPEPIRRGGNGSLSEWVHLLSGAQGGDIPILIIRLFHDLSIRQ
jgi:hypothetical protein